MKFTVVFSSHESIDLSYGLVFIPCPVWVKGKKEVINLNPETPSYQPRSIRRLLEKEGIQYDQLDPESRVVRILVHTIGSGLEADLEALVADLKQEGFMVSICR